MGYFDRPYRTHGFDLGNIKYSDKSLGPSLLEIIRSDEERLGEFFNIYKDFYRGQSHPISWTSDLAFIPFEERKKIGLDYQASEDKSKFEVSDEILKRNFDATLENLNSMIFASMGEEILKQEDWWHGGIDDAKWLPHHTLGGMYAEGKGKFIGVEEILDGELVGSYEGDKPDTSFYSSRTAKSSSGRQKYTDFGLVDILFHEAGLHGSGATHAYSGTEKRKEQTSQKVYSDTVHDLRKLLTDKEIDTIVGLMYNLDRPKRTLVGVGLPPKQY